MAFNKFWTENVKVPLQLRLSLSACPGLGYRYRLPVVVSVKTRHLESEYGCILQCQCRCHLSSHGPTKSSRLIMDLQSASPQFDDDHSSVTIISAPSRQT